MNKKIFIIAALCGALLPLNANALTGTVNLSCEKTTLASGATTTCTIKGNIPEEVSAVSIKLNVGENLTLTNVTTDSIWQGDGEGGNIELYTDTNKSGEFNIATFTVKAGSTGTSSISLSDVNLSDANFEETSFTVSPLNISITEATANDNETEEQPSEDSSATTGEQPNTGGSETIEPEDDKIEEQPSTGGSETIKPETDKEEVVENPNTGLYGGLAVVALIAVLGTVALIKSKKLNKFPQVK